MIINVLPNVISKSHGDFTTLSPVETTFKKLARLCMDNSIVFGEFSEPYRKQDNWKGTEVVVIDFDENIDDWKKIVPYIKPFNYFILATTSFSNENNKCRVIIETDYINDQKVYENTIKKIKFPFKYDVKSLSPVQYWYRHKKLLAYHIDGVKLASNPYPTTYTRPTVTFTPRPIKTPILTRLEGVSWFNMEMLSVDGSRFNNMMKLSSWLVEVAQISKEEVKEVVDALSDYETYRFKHFTKTKVHKFIDSL
ncbi:MAG: hypothetical protein VKL60_00370 [Sphaerospermopsis sp.]|nr:hypothetical protein [Sphaerospermopsis sp.]